MAGAIQRRTTEANRAMRSLGGRLLRSVKGGTRDQ